jgi:hypothetical protein
MILQQDCQMVNFQTQKSKFGLILECVAMKDAGVYYGH